jgi:proliferating cell nuclear antigen
MAFEIVYSNPSRFKNLIDILKEIEEEVVFVVDENALSSKFPDKAVVCLVDFSIRKEAFETYKVEAKTSFGLSLENLSSILSKAKKDDRLVLKYENGNEDTKKVKIIFDGKLRREFEVPVLDISQQETSEIETNNLEFKVKGIVSTEDLAQALDDIDLVSDYVIFETFENKLKLSCNGDTTNYNLVLELNEFNENAKSKYPLEYLKKILKAKKEFDFVILNFSTDYPLKMEFLDEAVSINMFLAPRVDTE